MGLIFLWLYFLIRGEVNTKPIIKPAALLQIGLTLKMAENQSIRNKRQTDISNAGAFILPEIDLVTRPNLEEDENWFHLKIKEQLQVELEQLERVIDEGNLLFVNKSNACDGYADVEGIFASTVLKSNVPAHADCFNPDLLKYIIFSYKIG